MIFNGKRLAVSGFCIIFANVKVKQQKVMCSKKYHKNENDYQEGRYSDGKHFSKKNKNNERKSRNNIKTNLKKEYL